MTPPHRQGLEQQSLIQAADEVDTWVANLAAGQPDAAALEQLAAVLEAGAATAREIAAT